MDDHLRLALIGRLLRSASHEINNPLTTISGFAQLIAMRTDDPQLRADAEQITGACTTASDYVAALAELAKGPTEPAPVDVGATVEDAIALVSYELRAAGIAVETVPPDRPTTITGRRGQLLEALLHLLVDALDGFRAVPDGPREARRVTVRSEVADRAVTIVVGSEGADGTARAAAGPDGGQWIGLDRCRELAAAMGGTLALETRPGGRAARLRLPLDTCAAPVEGRCPGVS